MDAGAVLKVLEQKCDELPAKPTLWSGKTETASRVQRRIELILDWARVRAYRVGANPARWRGNLEHQLSMRSKVQKVNHHAALPYVEIGAFIGALRAQTGVAACALEFLIRTATCPSETIGARWSEIDIDKGLWIISAERIKAGKKASCSFVGPCLCHREVTGAGTGGGLFSRAASSKSPCLRMRYWRS